jgi:hypothetical protein
MQCKIKLEIHKVRFDRGRQYYSYVQAPLTAFLVWVFATQTWFLKIAYAVSTIILIYIFGYIDEKIKMIHREQKRYADLNPITQKILDDLDMLKRKLL